MDCPNTKRNKKDDKRKKNKEFSSYSTRHVRINKENAKKMQK